MAQIADMNGDGCSEVVVGAPLEDDHQGAVYLFYSRDKIIQPSYKQVTSLGNCIVLVTLQTLKHLDQRKVVYPLRVGGLLLPLVVS